MLTLSQDLGSRGSTAYLKESKLWWEGPHWLKREENQWPNLSVPTLEPLEERATRHNKKAATTQSLVVTSNPIDLIVIHKFSNFVRVLRIL